MLTADSLMMARAYSWAFGRPARRLYYNVAATGMTVVVAAFIASVYLAALAAEHLHPTGPIAAYAGIADHFQLLGYLIVALFVGTWLGAALLWRVGRFEERIR